jgi:putative intracellular protease/amidase
MNLLMVLTSHAKLGNTDKKTGVWLEEFAAPYFVFLDAGATITLASPLGGQPPVDPKSEEPTAQTVATKRFYDDPEAKQAFSETVKLATVRAKDFDGVFYPGGHGPLWDLPGDMHSIRLIENFYSAGKPVAALCHAPGIFRGVHLGNGNALVKGKHVTGFSNTEEAAAKLTRAVPFLVEDALKSAGGLYSKAHDFHPHVVVDGNLITGQNPASSELAAQKMVALLHAKDPPRI